MFEYHENTLGVQAGWLFEKIMSEANYKKLRRTKQIQRLRPNAPGQPALIAVSSIPERFQRKIEELVGDPHRLAKRIGLEELIQKKGDTVTFFENYLKPDGKKIPDHRIQEYIASAYILDAITRFIAARSSKTQNVKKGHIWNTVAGLVKDLKTNGKYAHNLPVNARRLQEKHKQYTEQGYEALVHGGIGNQTARVVNDALHELINVLYTDETRPFVKTAYDWYLLFMAGELEVINRKTGEIYQRESFYKNGEPYIISESTFWHYINNPGNRVAVDSRRMDAKEFNDTHVPYQKRHKPFMSLSKISMDDRDIPHKMDDGTRVKAYYAFDVMSGALIGVSYSRKKDTKLFLDCFVDMFRLLHTLNMGTPLEVEVEHHLANNFVDTLLKPGTVFPHVRWCNPGNSQEKRAEHFNKVKKYKYEKRLQKDIGRFYAKGEAYRTRQHKVWDEEGMHLKTKVHQYARIVADDRTTVKDYNNDLHGDQKTFPGKTRLQVFIENANPNAAMLAESVYARYVGERVDTSITRSKYLRANNAYYELPHPELLYRLAPNNYKVQAYYMPTADGITPEVHVYQGEQFIATCRKAVTYNEAAAERTEADEAAMLEQQKYNARYRKMVSDNAPDRVEISKPGQELQPEEVVIIQRPATDEDLLDPEFELALERDPNAY